LLLPGVLGVDRSAPRGKLVLTAAYTATHQALAQAARKHSLRPYEVRVLLALHERGDRARTDDLEADLGLGDGTALRQALGVLYREGYCAGRAIDGSLRRRGVRTVVRVLPAGRVVVESFLHARAQYAKPGGPA
jgi:hypothetical protein